MEHSQGSNSKWADLKPGQLKKLIEDKFEGAAPGEYYALIVEVTNPITGYQVIKKPAT